MVDKQYEAIAPLRTELQLPMIIRNRLVESSSFMQMQIAEGETNAETRIELLDTRDMHARYALHPITGQRHQLRVHMASLGLPILNDRIYPMLHPELPMGEQPDFTQPLKLLAKSIEFIDPITGQPRHFESRQCLNF